MTVTDEREHRRGLVLGLTLAEILVLLLFLLLLALGAKIDQLQTTVASLTPIFEELNANGRIEENVQVLIEKLARAERADQLMSELRRENSDLRKQTAETKHKLGQFNQIFERAAQIDPNDPPAVLTRALTVVEQVGLDVNISQLKTAMEVAQQKEALIARMETVERERDQIRLQRDNLMRSGKGTTFPSCWISPDGKTEFIFDTTIRDSGLFVRDMAPASRANDQALQLVNGLQRGAEVTGEHFKSTTSKLFLWSHENNCRFFTNLRDETGAQSKERYKALRSLVEGHFYIRLVNSALQRPSNATTAISSSENSRSGSNRVGSASTP